MLIRPIPTPTPKSRRHSKASMSESERVVERTCIGCRKKGDQKGLIRYVVGPDNRVVVDYRKRLPGRGTYTCFDRSCIERAVNNGGFVRAFRGRVERPEQHELTNHACQAIRQRLVGLLGIARKAGKIHLGNGRVEAALKRGELAALVVAADKIGSTVDKLNRLAESSGVATFRILSREDLGQGVGRDGIDVAGVANRQFADLLALEIIRLQQIAGEK